MAISGAEFQALNAYQQQAYLNGDPNYQHAGPPQPTAQQAQTTAVAALATSSNFVTIPFGNTLETVLTLDSFLSQWAAGAITEPASLQGADPLTEAQAIAADRCAVIFTPDCAQAASLASSYGQQVAAAISAMPAPVTSSATVAAAAPTPAPAGTPSALPSGGGGTTAPPAAAAGGESAGGGIALNAQSVYGTPHADFILAGDGGGGSGGGVGSVLGAIGSTALNFIPLIGPLLGGLFGALFGGGGGCSCSKELNQLAQQLAQLGDAMTRFTWSVADGVGALWKADAQIWDNFMDQFWNRFKNIWKAVWNHLADAVPKILQIMRDARKKLDEIYKQYIQPALKYLQKVRQWLQILKALHVPFAAKLDKILGQIQGVLFTPLLWALRILGGYGYWINAIVTANYTLQRPLFLRTMQAYQADWINIWWNAQTPAAVAPPASSGGAPPAAPTIASEQAALHLYVTTGTGEYADTAAAAAGILAGVVAGR